MGSPHSLLPSVYRGVLITATLAMSWLGMQAVHEGGHVVGAWLTGGEVKRVVLHPLTISRTDLAHNPQPLGVVWAGPLLGCLLPLSVWALLRGGQAVARRGELPGLFVLRFFAGFCLVANGLYLGVGSFAHVGDCGDLMRHGARISQLWLFGLVAVPLGFALWNGQGKYFGLGPDQQPVAPHTAYAVLGVAAVLLAIGLAFDGK